MFDNILFEKIKEHYVSLYNLTVYLSSVSCSEECGSSVKDSSQKVKNWSNIDYWSVISWELPHSLCFSILWWKWFYKLKIYFCNIHIMISFKFEWESDGMLNMWQYLYVNIYDQASSAFSNLFLLNWCWSNVG